MAAHGPQKQCETNTYTSKQQTKQTQQRNKEHSTISSFFLLLLFHLFCCCCCDLYPASAQNSSLIVSQLVPSQPHRIISGLALNCTPALYGPHREQARHGDCTMVTRKSFETSTLLHIIARQPVLNWANVCSPNILRTVRRTMIRFLIELLVRRTWFEQFDELYFVLNWLVMRCKLRPELAADVQQIA